MSINTLNNTVVAPPTRNFAQYLESKDGLSPVERDELAERADVLGSLVVNGDTQLNGNLFVGDDNNNAILQMDSSGNLVVTNQPSGNTTFQITSYFGLLFSDFATSNDVFKISNGGDLDLSNPDSENVVFHVGSGGVFLKNSDSGNEYLATTDDGALTYSSVGVDSVTMVGRLSIGSGTDVVDVSIQNSNLHVVDGYLDIGSGSATISNKGTVNLNGNITLDQNGFIASTLGFGIFAKTPVLVQPATPTDIGGVISLLQLYGLCA